MGKAKFNSIDWQSIVACIWEQRSLETIKGTKMAMIHALCKASWGTDRPFEDPRTDHFSTSTRRIVRQILELVPDSDISNQLKEMMAYYDPSHKNDRKYMEGRWEQLDIDGTNTKIISVGGYHAVRRGKPNKNFKGDKVLNGRSSKIAKIHMLAVLGKVTLPAGVTHEADNTLLPIPLAKNSQIAADDKKRFEPVSIFCTK